MNCTHDFKSRGMSTFMSCRRVGCGCGAIDNCHGGFLSATLPSLGFNKAGSSSGSGDNCSSRFTHRG